MSTGGGSQDASSSATGYLYQVNWALADLLQRGQDRPDLSVCIEGDDDIVWSDAIGDPQELIQTKAHNESASPGAGIGNRGVDLWKTLAIWLRRDDAFDPNGPDLTLVSTSIAPPGSAAEALVPLSSASDRIRDVERADSLLAVAADKSTNDETDKARAAFLKVDPSLRQILLHRVQIYDTAFKPGDAFTVVKDRLMWSMPMAAGAGAQESFLGQVWGWWYETAVKLLAGMRKEISVMEVKAAFSSIRDQYTKDALPTTVEWSDITEQHIDAYAGHRFVAQLEWVRYSPRSLRYAIMDFHRAVTQETHWLDHQLVGIDELEKFETDLRHEWERAFAQMIEDLSDLALEPDELEKAKVDAGQKFARKVLDATDVVLRAKYQETWLARGKRHQFADDPDHTRAIGWHPDFRQMLAKVIAPPAHAV